MSTKKLQIIEGKLLQSGTIVNASLNAANWTGYGPYTQSIIIDVAPNNKIDIQADADTLSKILSKEYALCVCNDNGAVTVYAIDKRPQIDLDVQLTITAVKKSAPDDIVWGNVLR